MYDVLADLVTITVSDAFAVAYSCTFVTFCRPIGLYCTTHFTTVSQFNFANCIGYVIIIGIAQKCGCDVL